MPKSWHLERTAPLSAPPDPDMSPGGRLPSIQHGMEEPAEITALLSGSVCLGEPSLFAFSSPLCCPFPQPSSPLSLPHALV